MERVLKVTVACKMGQHSSCFGTRYTKDLKTALGPCECPDPYHNRKEVKHESGGTQAAKSASQ